MGAMEFILNAVQFWFYMWTFVGINLSHKVYVFYIIKVWGNKYK